MPIYEYQCKKCKKTTEILQSILDDLESYCTTCSTPMKRIISNSTFILKGDGWYATEKHKS